MNYPQLSPSPTPIHTAAAMSSSRARNFRRRAGDNEDDNQKDDANAASTRTSTTTAAPKPKPKKLLSFADDEDAETPSRSSSVKRPSKLPSSSSSHKVTSLRDRLTHSTASVPLSNVQPQAGTYTKEALLELQKNTRTLAPSRPASSSSSEPSIVLKGLLKPPSPSDGPAVSQNLRQSEDDELSEEDEDRRDRRDAQTRFASMGIEKQKDSPASSLFPDQATINAIRAKRERLRKSRAAAPDYISLDGGSNHGEAEGLSDEEPEFRGRIAMFGEKQKTDATEMKKKKGVFEDDEDVVEDRAMAVNIAKDSGGENGDNEEDEEEKIWEEEQFRKGLGKRMDDGTSRVTVTASVPVVQSLQPQQQHKSVYPAPSAVGGLSIGGAIGGFDAMMSIPQQAETAKKALHENVRRLKVWNALIER